MKKLKKEDSMFNYHFFKRGNPFLFILMMLFILEGGQLKTRKETFYHTFKPNMDNSFELPITFNGEELAFRAKLIPFGYINRFEIEIDGKPIIFEQDEEGQYRALQNLPITEDAISIDAGLLKEIASVIQSVTD